MQRAKLEISGMNCGHCVAAVRSALESLDGVTIEDVSIGSAAVAYDPAAVSAERISRAVADAGYPATLVPVRES